MNEAMRQAFRAGSGIDPVTMKWTLMLMAIAVVLVCAVWVLVQLAEARSKDEISNSEIINAVVQLLIIVGLTLFVVM
ncbi:DUF3262 family protein [Ottowia sp.]|uniref:DUF3262 family protein n=1 Tax=Ottowia sp. TaxID=1898956 RepID=UPI003A8A8EB1